MSEENANNQEQEQNLGESGEQVNSSGEDTDTSAETGSEENGSESGEQSTEDTTASGEDTTESTDQGSEEEEQDAEDTSAVDPDPKPAGYATVLEKRVEFEGQVIEAVLNDGRATETQYHCKFTNGTTGHVPKEFLDKELAQE
jgi:hypothetical protein